MTRNARPDDAGGGALERGVRRAVDRLGLDDHASTLGLPRRAAAIDRWFASGAGPYPEGPGYRAVVDGAVAVVAGVAVELFVVGLYVLLRTVIVQRVVVGEFALSTLLVPYSLLPPVAVVGGVLWRRSGALAVPSTVRPLPDVGVLAGYAAALLVMGFDVSVGTALLTSALPPVEAIHVPVFLGVPLAAVAVAPWLATRATADGSALGPVEAAGHSLLAVLVMLLAHLVFVQPALA